MDRKNPPDAHGAAEKPPAKRTPARGRRTPRGVLRSIFTGFLGAAALMVVLLWALIDRPLPLPDILRERVEAAVNAGSTGSRVAIGGIDMVVGPDGATRAILKNVGVRDAGGVPLAAFSRVRANLAPKALLDRRIAPTEVVVEGVEVTLRRRIDGRLEVVGQGVDATSSRDDPLRALADALAAPPFDRLEVVSVTGVTLSLEDARSGRVWQATGGDAVLRRKGNGLNLSIGAQVFNGSDDLARIEVTLDHPGAGREGSLGVRLDAMPARDIAQQSPALAWLAALDAPISGAVRARIEPGGGVVDLQGKLDLGEGALSPQGGGAPVAFSRARGYFTYDRDAARVELSEIEVTADDLDVAGSARVYLDQLTGGWPGAFLGQITLSRLDLGERFLPRRTRFQAARADLRVTLSPFAIDLGQASLRAGPARLDARGRVTADRDGWHVALDAETARMATGEVLALWPARLAPGTRTWLETNVAGGDMTRVALALRGESGTKPRIDLSFGFEGARVRVMKALPAIEGGGFGSLTDGRLAVEVGAGVMETPEGALDVAGTSFVVLDTRQKPRRAETRIRASGALTPALWVLDQPPFRVLSRAGRGLDVATGRVRVDATVRFPLKKGMTPDEVDYAATAVIEDAVSETLVAGRRLSGERLAVAATPRAVQIAGPMKLDDTPLEATWTQPLGEAAADGGRVEGTVTLSDAVARRFGVNLPKGAISGEGEGRFALILPKGEAPRFTLRSDLQGLRLSAPQIGWSKAAGREGALDVAMTLGEAMKVDRLKLSAPGLDATGQVLFSEGAFARLGLSRLRVAGWLDAAVDLTPGPGGAARVALKGGRFDLRNFSGGGGGGSGAPIEVTLDEVIVTDGIRIRPLRGRMTARAGGIDGQFTGLVGGRTPITARLAPAPGGTALRVVADDAGGVLRDAGLMKTAQDGRLDLVMTPVRGARGWYDGTFRIDKVRLRKAPAMVDLLDAISIVGLIQQLEGPGIHFDVVDGRFRLGPDRLQLVRAAAVGGSIGVSADGVFDLNSKMMSLKGVVSPVYFLNGIGAILTRRGEGLFGFNYTMSGPFDAPRVGVNPLSILTPGMFREIFRRPAPTQ